AVARVRWAMSRHAVTADALALFMDGDPYLEPGMLRKCLPLFAVCPKLDALTTDERSVIHGPVWMQWWVDMRLAQRHLAMQSVALSGKLLTLTGRGSFFPAGEVGPEGLLPLVGGGCLGKQVWG